MPFTYLIGWSMLNKWYYGVRWAKTASPDAFWTEYKTSSRYVKQFIQVYGEPDVIQVRRKFTDQHKARLFESRVLHRLNYIDPFGPKSKWLNRTTNKSIYNPTAYIRTPVIRARLSKLNKGKIVSDDTRKKISLSNTGKKHSEESELLLVKNIKVKKCLQSLLQEQ